MTGSGTAGRRGARRRGPPSLTPIRVTATQVAERIRSAIADITVVGVERDITASLGVADLLEHAGTADGLTHAADRALYTAKSLGRDRVVVASAGQEPIVTPSPRGSAEALSPPTR